MGCARVFEIPTATPGDLEIEEWVFAHYGFVPHPLWITHCKELYLGIPRSPQDHPAWHECPPENRFAIFQAFVHFAMCEAQAPRKVSQ